MSDLWVPISQTLPTHPKTLEASYILDVPPVQMVGHMVCLWLWAVDVAGPNGELAHVSNRTIAKIAQWQGNPDDFANALLVVGFLDQGEEGILVIHDWDDYLGRLMDHREASRQRQQRSRDRKKGYLAAQSARSLTTLAESEPTDPQAPTHVTRDVTSTSRPIEQDLIEQDLTVHEDPHGDAAASPAADQDAAERALPSLTPRRRTPAHAEQFQALLDGLGMPAARLTKGERDKVNTAARQLDDAHYGREEIIRAIERWPRFYECVPCSAMAIANNISTLLTGKPRAAPRLNGKAKPLEKFEEDYSAALRAEYNAG